MVAPLFLIKNSALFNELSIVIDSNDRRVFNIQSIIKNGVIKKRSIYEDNDVLVHLLENDRMFISLDGMIGASLNILASIQLNQPLYRVVNKSNSNQIINTVFSNLGNKDLSATINVSKADDLLVSVDTNIDALVSKLADELLVSFVENERFKLVQQVKKSKKSTFELIQKDISSFDDIYAQLNTQSNFHLNEIESSYADLKNKVLNIQQSAEDQVKSTLLDAIDVNL